MVKTIIITIEKVSNFFGFISIIITCILTFLMLLDVFMRFVVNQPLFWVLDLTQLLQAAMALVAACYVLKIGGHVNMSAVVDAVNNKWKKILSIINMTFTVICCAWMAYLGWPFFVQSTLINESSFGISMPLAPWKLLVMIGFILLSLQALGLVLKYIITAPEDFEDPKGE